MSNSLQEKIIDDLCLGNYKDVKLNIDNIDPSYIAECGNTLLHEATRMIGQNSLFKKIVYKFKDNINAVDKSGATALKYACCEENNLAKVELLLKEGADPNKGDFDGFTPIFCSIGYGYVELTKALIKFGANLDIKASTHYRKKMFPVHNVKSVTMYKYLCEIGAAIDEKDGNGLTLLDYLKEDGDDYKDIINMIIHKPQI